MYCTNCGKKISDNSRFCEHCGSSVSMEEDLPKSQQEPQWSATQSRVKMENFTKKAKKETKQKKRGGFISKVFITALIAVGVWFMQGLFNDGGDGNNVSNVIKDILPNNIKSDADIIRELSTYERPTWEEFAWYDEVFKNGIWSDATPVTEFPYMLGGWKCIIVYNPYTDGTDEGRELANVELSYDSGKAYAVVDWYQFLWNGEAPYDETGDPDSEFSGSYENEMFELSGPCDMTIGSFFKYKGKYYGFGYLVAYDGTAANFWMMR